MAVCPQMSVFGTAGRGESQEREPEAPTHGPVDERTIGVLH
jgi:hypothetical protein